MLSPHTAVVVIRRWTYPLAIGSRAGRAQLVQFRTHRLRPDARYTVISQTADVDPGKTR